MDKTEMIRSVIASMAEDPAIVEHPELKEFTIKSVYVFVRDHCGVKLTPTEIFEAMQNIQEVSTIFRLDQE